MILSQSSIKSLTQEHYIQLYIFLKVWRKIARQLSNNSTKLLSTVGNTFSIPTSNIL